MNKEDILNFTGNFQLPLFYVLVRRSASYNHYEDSQKSSALS